MCLNEITKRENDMSPAAIGYKVVRKIGNGYSPVLLSYNRDMPYLDSWSVKEHTSEVKTRYDERIAYLPGVHAYVHLEDAKEGLAWYLHITPHRALCLVKVYLRGPICEGKGDGLGAEVPVIVYREMRIIEEVS